MFVSLWRRWLDRLASAPRRGPRPIGNPNFAGQLDFNATQTLTGNGSVLFGANANSILGAIGAGTTLTIDTGILVHGQYGKIGFDPAFGDAVSVVNLGTVSADSTSY